MAERINITCYTMLLNFLPFLYHAAGVGLFLLAKPMSFIVMLGLSLVWIYLIPPIICRLTLLLVGYPCGRALNQSTPIYKVWWFLAQWQVIFNRLPWLEEMLRLIPGAYSLWLNLWGAHISLLTYWGPGARVLDRYLLRVGKGAVIGTDCLLSGHLGILGEKGEPCVDVAEIEIAAGAIIGARAMISPGCRIASDELVPAGKMLQPYSHWQDGKKIRI